MTQGTKNDRHPQITDILFLVQKIVPEELEDFLRRYQVLKSISLLQPAGRRTISVSLQFTERVVRSEVEKLFGQGLIEIGKSGMSVTPEGNQVLLGLEEIISSLRGITKLQEQVCNILGIDAVIIVPGDCDKNPEVKKELGQAAAKALLKVLTPSSRIAITGGTTVAALVESVPKFSVPQAEYVVPGRGSMGGGISVQSDTLVSMLGEKLCCAYRLLRIPEGWSKEIMDEVQKEPDVRHTMLGIEEANTLVFGIGDAMDMAKKRDLPQDVYSYLQRKRAVAEAFGYYFDNHGELVYISRTMGVALEDVKNMKDLIGIAGGAKKASAVYAVGRNMQKGIFILDEGVARAVVGLDLENLES